MNHNGHYDSIAQNFNLLWQFSDPYKDFVIARIQRFLKLSADDTLVDIGGGTGSFTERLADENSLSKAYCIEPSKEMCTVALQQPHITALNTDSDGFIALELDYSKMLLKEVIHHLHDRPLFWKNVYPQLPIFGKILIITRPQEVEFPFWNGAKEAFKAHQPSLSLLKSELESGGFEVSVSVETHQFQLSKEDWYTMLRHRFMSDLSEFSDEEINDGINEIDPLYPNNIITIKDNLLFITATKN